MKNTSFILLIITCSCLISGCRQVNLTPADELTGKTWESKTLNGTFAELSFDVELNKADLYIKNTDNEVLNISGNFAVDSKSLYIISDNMYKTYCFDYKVYANRVELSYNGTNLTFYCKEKEP